MIRGAGRLAALALVLVSACTAPVPPPPHLVLRPTGFDRLPGWAADDLSGALDAFARSCRILLKAPPARLGEIELAPSDWQEPCAALAGVTSGEAARRLIETGFVPVQLFDHDRAQGLFTGYYEAELHGARRPDARFGVPLYRRPPDLVTADLSRFRTGWAGEHVSGRLAGSTLLPYPSRAEIEAGALTGRGLELLWVDSAIDAFFLAIQGSGRVILPDGTVVRLGYDGDNGHPYVAIGRKLVERGIPPEAISMASLRDWIAEHGAEGTALMAENPSYVFFREIAGDGPIGAEGVVLTPGRCAAVDHRFIPYGLPLWVDTSDAPDGRLRRLFVAQDTGGAIRGPVRADLFFGYGPAAADHAGRLKGTGSAWLLVPKPAVARWFDQKRSGA